MKKYLLFTLDLEEMDRLNSFTISLQGWEVISRIMDDYGITGTLFTTGSFAKRYPKVVKEAFDKGHEIASHGMDHRVDLKSLSEDKAFNMLKKARESIVETAGISPIGFRAPRMTAPSPHILKKAGFVYDSSIHPTWVPGRYNNIHEKREVYPIRDKEGRMELVEVPISVTPRFRIPLSWIWFRNTPFLFIKHLVMRSLIEMDHLLVYFHPWEFVELSNHGLSYPYWCCTGRKLGEKVKIFFDYLLKEVKLESKTVERYLRIRGLID